MSLTLLQLADVVLAPLALGAALLRAVGVVPRTDPWSWAGWAWLQGTLATALVLSAWAWLGWPLEAIRIAPLLYALAGLVLLFARRVPVRTGGAERAATAGARWERVLFAAVVAFLALATVDRIALASLSAVAGSDEAHIWTSKAKVLFESGGFGEAFREATTRHPTIVSHRDYPPLNPLLQTWVYAHAGRILHVENRLPVQLFTLALLSVLAGAVRRRARPAVGALFVAAAGTLGFTAFSMTRAYSDVIVAAVLLVVLDLWDRYERDGGGVWLRCLAGIAPVAVWGKNEGLLLLLAFGTAWCVARLRRATRPAAGSWGGRVALALPLLLSLAYLGWFNRHFGFQGDLWQGYLRPGHVDDPESAPNFVQIALRDGRYNAPLVAAHFADLVALRADQTRLLLFAFLALCAGSPRRMLLGAWSVASGTVLLALLGYMAIYLGTYRELEAHLETSAHRLVYQLLPAAGLCVLLYVVDALPRWAAPAPVSASATPSPASGREAALASSSASSASGSGKGAGSSRGAGSSSTASASF